MPYTYTDRHGDELNVLQHPDKVRLGVPGRLIDIKSEDAPYIALAILEAAGVEDFDPEDRVNLSHDPELQARAALTQLKRWKARRGELAEREAEDAKVREFIRITRDFTIEEPNEKDREMYRAARRFFEGDAKPEPRVLNHGDPEPPDDTKWRDTGGNIWYHGYSCHRGYLVWQFQPASGSSFGRWDHLDACFFPMTEVTL